MSYCPACGTSVTDSDIFCTSCGAETRVDTATVVASPVRQAPAATPSSGNVSTNSIVGWFVIDNGGVVFDDIEGFDWGAALWGGIWAFFHGQWKIGAAVFVGALVLGGIPVINILYVFAIAGLLGATGYTLAATGARPGRYATLDDLKQSQRIWAISGWIALAVLVVVTILAGVVASALSFLSLAGGY